MANLGALTEDWLSSTLDVTKWQDASGGGGAYHLAGDGRLRVTAPGGGGWAGVNDVQYVGPTPFTLLDGYWRFEIITPPTHLDTFLGSTTYARDDTHVTNWRSFAFQVTGYSGVFKLNIHLASDSIDGDIYRIPFDPSAHRHLGFTASSDGLRWWASRDGVTWNLLHYDATQITSPDAVCDLYSLGIYVPGTNADSSVFGPVNTLLPASASAVVNYGGNWRAFPTIKVTGPITNPAVTNTDTGETLSFSGLVVASGEELLIDLTYGNKLATIGGSSVLGYLDITSALAAFHLAPAPGAAGGVNHIALTGTSTDGNTALEVKWYDRFVGI